MHWISWERTCVDKENGGLWFRDLEKFNQDLLVKQGWRLPMFDESLNGKVVRSRYYPEGDFLSTRLDHGLLLHGGGVFVWMRIASKRSTKNVGPGEHIFVWTDKWLLGSVLVAPLRKKSFFDLDLRVCD